MNGLLSKAAQKGRNGDTMVAHLTPGEVVIPREVAALRPDLVGHVAQQIRQMGGDPRRIVAGRGRRNPNTGMEEFATEDEVRAAYQQVLGRVPDQPGLDYWMNNGDLDMGAFVSAAQPEINARTTPVTDAVSTDAVAAQSAPQQLASNATLGSANTYTAQQAGLANLSDPTQWGVTRDQTVQGQMDSIIAADSPLMQRAAARGAMGANARGLLNSSLAVGAAQDAVMGQAMPMAQQDASTYAQSAQYNADQSNVNNRLKFTEGNALNKFNTSEANQAGQFNAGQKNEFDLSRFAQDNETARFNAGQGNSMSIANAQMANSVSLANANNRTQVDITNARARNETAIADANRLSTQNLALLSSDTQIRVADLTAGYGEVARLSATASTLFTQFTDSVEEIMSSDLTAEAKDEFISAMTGYMMAGLQLQGTINGDVDLMSVINDLLPASPGESPEAETEMAGE